MAGPKNGASALRLTAPYRARPLFLYGEAKSVLLSPEFSLQKFPS
jgi:hypothetical protein